MCKNERQHLFLLLESDHYLPTRAGDTPTTKKGEIEGLTKGTWGLMTCQFPWFLVGFSLGVAQDSNDWNDVTLIRIVETLDLPVKGWPKGTLFGRWWTSNIYIIETHLLTNSCSICFFSWMSWLGHCFYLWYISSQYVLHCPATHNATAFEDFSHSAKTSIARCGTVSPSRWMFAVLPQLMVVQTRKNLPGMYKIW